MKEKISKLLLEDWKYLLTGVILLVVALLLVTVSYKNITDFTLNLPTNNTYGLISYIIILLFGIAGIIVLKNIDKKQINLEKVYLLLVIPIGILFCLANPLRKSAR